MKNVLLFIVLQMAGGGTESVVAAGDGTGIGPPERRGSVSPGNETAPR